MNSPAIAVFRARFGSGTDQRTPSERGERLVRRLRESTHRRAFIGADADAAPPPPRDQPEVSQGGWHESSFELMRGAVVSEGANALEADRYTAWFSPQDEASETLG